MASPERFLALLALLFGGLLTNGCSVFPGRASVRVAPAPPPVASVANPLPSLPDSDSRLPLILAQSWRFTHANVVKFIAAREAFWDFDTDAAVKLLRELREADGIPPNYFQDLTLQCYQQTGRWAEALRLYHEFGLEEGRREELEFARFMAGLSPQESEFAPGAPPVPMRKKNSEWLVVEGTINGVKARLGLDTGAGISVVSARFARRAKVEIHAQTISLNDSNGNARNERMALVRELRLGGLTVRNVPAVASRALVWPLLGVDAVVGWPVLQQVDFTCDFPAGLVTVAAPDGPICPEPNLSGRVAPILTVLSAEGQPLELMLDTGASGNRRTSMWLADNEGVLATKLPLADFQQSWWPTITGGLHSLSVSWPRRAKPFAFWMGGHRFEMPSAALDRKVHLEEQLVHVDGVVGNTPFLGGRLRISGVRRLLEFTPGDSRMLRRSPTDAEAVAAPAASVDPSRRRRAVLPAAESTAPVDLAAVSSDRIFLSDAAWLEAKVGWGDVARNRFWVDEQLAVRLALQGQVFEKGLYAHSPSRYLFPLDGKWRTFTATVGIRDGAHEQGSAVFTVRGDGRELYVSPVLRVGSRHGIRVELAGIRQLELVADGGEGHPHNSWAIWADPLVTR